MQITSSPDPKIKSSSHHLRRDIISVDDVVKIDLNNV
jgi:hypothetical protein